MEIGKNDIQNGITRKQIRRNRVVGVARDTSLKIIAEKYNKLTQRIKNALTDPNIDISEEKDVNTGMDNQAKSNNVN